MLFYHMYCTVTDDGGNRRSLGRRDDGKSCSVMRESRSSGGAVRRASQSSSKARTSAIINFGEPGKWISMFVAPKRVLRCALNP